ncbi:MAG: carbohydrate ABC transporter permease [Lachnospiraceae bacterium]|nr:carbohydrate ABC transporter permease [Lachnospiraceae bacterium]
MGKKRKGFEALDWILLVLLTAGLLAVLIPFLNVIAISFTSYKEYMQSTWVVWPKNPTLDAYKELFKDSRILIGYKTTLMYLLVGLPLNLLLCVTLAYALSRKGWPGRKVILMLVLFTMIFNGGIVPMYLVMKSFNLTNTIWSVILAQGMNTFNMILIYNYFCSLPEALVESASLDGADEWTIMARIIVPLAKPILATVVLFVAVQLWNEYFMSMIFLRSKDFQSLQQVLRSIVMDSQVVDTASQTVDVGERNFTDAIKMAAVMATMVPVMCVYPFLQKYFAKGIMMGAIKS